MAAGGLNQIQDARILSIDFYTIQYMYTYTYNHMPYVHVCQLKMIIPFPGMERESREIAGVSTEEVRLKPASTSKNCISWTLMACSLWL